MDHRLTAHIVLYAALLALASVGCSDDGDPVDADAGFADDIGSDAAVETDTTAEVDAEEPVDLVLDSIAPQEGSTEGGTEVTLGGQGFLEGMTVFFDDAQAPEVSRQGGLSAQAVTPPGQEGPVDVRVENPDGTEATLEQGFEYVDEQQPDPDPAEIDYCETETETVEAAPGEETPQITGIVFVDDVTPGEGEGEDVEGRLLWGSEEDPEDWTNTTDAHYLEDADGLSEGDLANDRYAATITADNEGEYGFVYQFRIDDGDWVHCNTGGSEGAGDFAPEEVGTLVVESENEKPVEKPEHCQIQHPVVAEQSSLADDDQVALYGRIYEPGVTDASELDPEVRAQALIGAAGADPVVDVEDLLVVEGIHNEEYGGDDAEFEAAIEFDAGGDDNAAVTESGTYGFRFRVTLDDGDTWTDCDLDGAVDNEENIEPDRLGALVVFDETPNRVHFCATWPEALTGPDDGDGPTIDMEVYEEGITDDASQQNGELLEVEAGFGPRSANPVFGYQWTTLDFQGTVAGNDNNFQYAGPIYDEASAPEAGEFLGLTRARIAGEEAWRYCVVNPPDPYDEDADYVIFDRTTSITVEDGS